MSNCIHCIISLTWDVCERPERHTVCEPLHEFSQDTEPVAWRIWRGVIMKILLVDCDAAVLQYLEKLLRDEGSEVAPVLYENEASATRAIEMAGAQQFDAAFVDFRMPSLSGIELCAQIKRVSPHTRTILMSTPIPPEGRAQLLSQGVTSEFFVEPSALQNLRDALGLKSWERDDAYTSLERPCESNS